MRVDDDDDSSPRRRRRPAAAARGGPALLFLLVVFLAVVRSSASAAAAIIAPSFPGRASSAGAASSSSAVGGGGRRASPSSSSSEVVGFASAPPPLSRTKTTRIRRGSAVAATTAESAAVVAAIAPPRPPPPAVPDSSAASVSPPPPTSAAIGRRRGGDDDGFILPDEDERRERRLRRLLFPLASVARRFGPSAAAAAAARSDVRRRRRPTGASGGTDLSSFFPPPEEATTVVGDGASRRRTEAQLRSITSGSPAVLLRSGPGTGKSSVLSSRIAYLLGTAKCRPEEMVVLSFANRDAQSLKREALDLLYPTGSPDDERERDETDRRLWSGTVHGFASALMRRYGSSECGAHGGTKEGGPLRVISTAEMRSRIDRCLKNLLERTTSPDGGDEERGREIQSLHLSALRDVRDNRGSLLHNVRRCVELWKESDLLPPPFVHAAVRVARDDGDDRHRECERGRYEDDERKVREDCVELAMRLGVPESGALLGLELFPSYQATHAASNTVDPADLASVARNFLLSRPRALNAVRSKLKHVILDEYQDVSVSQHALLRLIVRGPDDDDEYDGTRRRRLPATTTSGDDDDDGGPTAAWSDAARTILTSPSWSSSSRSCPGSYDEDGAGVCYDVPSLFCAGDPNQSVYGWRGASPSLTVMRFKRDYPQGVIVPLDVCHRLPTQIRNAADVMMDVGTAGEGGDDGGAVVGGRRRRRGAGDGGGGAGAGRGGIASAGGRAWAGKAPLAPPRAAAAAADGGGADPLLRSDDDDAVVRVRGYWDAREESNRLASTIRKRARRRTKDFAAALRRMGSSSSSSGVVEERAAAVRDLTDVAVVVRSKSSLKLVEEALRKVGVPSVRASEEEEDRHYRSGADDSARTVHPVIRRPGVPETLPMKPVTLLTMHGAKGREYDDVYLPFWTEGTFPHPTSARTDRMHEERRLAYVSLTRARRTVHLSHSFVERVVHCGLDGERRKVTRPVEPSRFLYEMMPNDRERRAAAATTNDADDDASPKTTNDDGWRVAPIPRRTSPLTPGAIWNHGAGFKEYIAGRDLPPRFAGSYRTPPGFEPEDDPVVSRRRDRNGVDDDDGERRLRKLQSDVPPSEAAPSRLLGEERPTNRPIRAGLCDGVDCEVKDARLLAHLESVRVGLEVMNDPTNRGSCKRCKAEFRSLLRDAFGMERGSAIVLDSAKFGDASRSVASANGRSEETHGMYVLLSVPEEYLSARPLSRCTGRQLGLYLVYLIVKSGEEASSS